MYKFDFDAWADLYKNDPAEFERRRRQILEEEILKSPIKNRARLRALQVECDAIRSALPPIEAAEVMSKMAARKLGDLKLPLTQLRAILEDI